MKYFSKNLSKIKFQKLRTHNFSNKILLNNIEIEYVDEMSLDQNAFKTTKDKNFLQAQFSDEVSKNSKNFKSKFGISSENLDESRLKNKRNNDPLGFNFLPLKTLLNTHYINTKQNSDEDKIVRKLTETWINNINDIKLIDSLETYVRNCLRYNLQEHLNETSFKDQTMRNYILNTDFHESLSNLESGNLVLEQNIHKLKEIHYERAKRVRDREEFDGKVYEKQEIIQTEVTNHFAESLPGRKLQEYKDTDNHNNKIFSQYFKTGEQNDEEIKENYDSENLYFKKLGEHLAKVKARVSRKQSLNLSIESERINLEENRIMNDALSVELEDSDIKIYPGSVKGPNPEDDPQFYTYWYTINQPKQLKELMDTDDNIQGLSQVFSTVKLSTNKQICTKASYLKNGDSAFVPYEGLDHMNEQVIMGGDYNTGKPLLFSTLKSHLEIDPIPPELDINTEKNVEEVAKWSIFTMMPKYKEFFSLLFDFKKNVPKEVWDKMNNKVTHPQSLFSYYYLLPEWARDHPIIQSVVRNLEYTKAHTSYREKQLLVNLACATLMPMSKEMDEFFYLGEISRQKMVITDENVEDLLNLDENDEKLDQLIDETETDSDHEYPTFQKPERRARVQTESKELKREKEVEKAVKADQKAAKKKAAEKAKESGKKTPGKEGEKQGEEAAADEEEEEEEEEDDVQEEISEEEMEVEAEDEDEDEEGETKKKKKDPNSIFADDDEGQTDEEAYIDKYVGKEDRVKKSGLKKQNETNKLGEDGEEIVFKDIEDPEEYYLNSLKKDSVEELKQNFNRGTKKSGDLSNNNKSNQFGTRTQNKTSQKTKGGSEEFVQLEESNKEEIPEEIGNEEIIDDEIVEDDDENNHFTGNLEHELHNTILREHDSGEGISSKKNKFFTQLNEFFGGKVFEDRFSDDENVVMENNNIYKFDEEENVLESYIKPFHKKMPQDVPQLPFDYYQNDDGFWDSYIKEKYNDSVSVKDLIFKPMIQQKHRLRTIESQESDLIEEGQIGVEIGDYSDDDDDDNIEEVNENEVQNENQNENENEYENDEINEIENKSEVIKEDDFEPEERELINNFEDRTELFNILEEEIEIDDEDLAEYVSDTEEPVEGENNSK